MHSHRLRFIVPLILLIACVTSAQAQQYSWDDFFQEYTDDERADDEEWMLSLEELKAIHEEPMNINTAGIDDLMRLPFLTAAQIEEIHAYIYLHGEMQTLGELRLLKSLDEDTRRKLALFVYAAPVPKQGKLLSDRMQSTLSSRIDIPLYYRRGFQVDDGYRGDALYHRIRYDLRASRHLEAGLRIEKDAGERYYDTYGAYAMLRDVGAMRRLAVGDYRAGFGEGVVMGGSAWNSKSSPTLREQTGIRPMTSMDEARFLRGAAVTLALGRRVELSAFGSYKKADATLNSDGEVQTLITSGYHRTASERASRRDVEVTQAGGNLTWRKDVLHVGFTGYTQHFSRNLNPGTQLYRRIYPHGSSFGVAGLNYGYSGYRLSISGETAVSGHHAAWATLHRVVWTVNHRYTLSLIQRYYDRHYVSFLATSFAENSTAQNENGVLLHLNARPWDRWQVVAYADFFHNPWPRYRMTHSSNGQEAMMQIGYQPDGANTLSLRYQMKRKEQADQMEPHHRLRLQWTCEPSQRWKLQTTGLLHFVEGERGAGVQETAQFAPVPERMKLTLTGCYFHTTDYLSRLYFHLPALYNSVVAGTFSGHGFNTALSARFVSRNQRWMIEGRYALCRYFDRDVQSSGLQTIYSPWKNDLSAQFRLRF